MQSYCNELKREKDSFDAFRDKMEIKKKDLQTNLLLSLEEVQKERKKLDAYLNIAKAHTSNQVESEYYLPYDEEKLAKLSVQISRSFDDEYASKLFTEVTGQINAIEDYTLSVQNETKQEQKEIDWKIGEEKKNSIQRQSFLLTDIISFLKSDDYRLFIEKVNDKRSTYDFSRDSLKVTEENDLCFGEVAAPIPIMPEFESELRSLSGDVMDCVSNAIYIPLSLPLSGGVLLAEYSNSTEKVLLKGIQAVLLNLARYYREKYDQIIFIDPIRFNNSGLGCLAPLTDGKSSFISSVPTSMEEIRNSLKLIVDTINNDERKGLIGERKGSVQRIFVFHNFPQAYDDSLISKIRQLCVNADYYGITVVLTTNKSVRNITGSDALEYIRNKSIHVKISPSGESSVFCKDVNSNVKFKWFKAPEKLPQDVYDHFITNKPVANTSNKYEEHFELTKLPQYTKGKREINNIPYGIDSDGNILSLDFENSNFATFICGASRSGKSTLLHTIITGILRNNHPDDVEMWLIDFKMTEFSKYTAHLPPQVRYIILDESPELVYDIVDRLSEILLKRQNIFKGKWDKLSDVPTEKYMPSIFVIIDEFSIMSQILADSVTLAKDNYMLKLQTLLAKGAALGMHFIFASQGFTSGTRGLNDFSKKQVQQRIAMKTEVSEIKATLDLQSMGDDDRAQMEQLPVHHALVKSRVPTDIKGNYLIYSKVLHISDTNAQLSFIEKIKDELVPAHKYCPHDSNNYIDKKAMIVDGNKYSSFANNQNEMLEYLNGPNLTEESTVLFVGEPRRMMTVFPVIVDKNFQENLLLIGSLNEKESISSIIICIEESLKMLNRSVTIITSNQNSIHRHLQQSYSLSRSRVIKDLNDICDEIKTLRKRIENRIFDNEFYVIMGLESIFSDMIFYSKDSTSRNSDSTAKTQFEKRNSNEDDLLTLISKLEQGEAVELPTNEGEVYRTASRLQASSRIYDAREDLKYVLTYGPKLGYHFALLYNSVGDFKQTKLDSALFNHRIFFRTPRIDANGIVDGNNASIIAELPDHCYRYTNGLDSLSFRPYLHNGIVIDGWQILDNGSVDIVEEEEEYLL